MKNLAISFSGGRTSAYMAKLLADECRASNRPFVTVFANTGQEHEATLRFVDRCDKAFGLNVVWLEAVVHPDAGAGTKFQIVDFETASRAGEPFEAVIQKYGIPNPNFRHCNREMKLRPIDAYVRSLGWASGTYDMAVGIRADEADRISPGAKARGIVYPLIRLGVRKSDVLSWWAQQSFDLDLAEHWGNCKTCWKKSARKLMTVAKEDPSAFDFFARMERQYPDAGPGDFDRPRRFFRENKSVADILAASRLPFVPFRENDTLQFEMDMLDLGGGCGESCEVFADE